MTYRIFSCYVYKEDAKSLLSAEATLDQSIIEDVPGLDADEEMLVSNRPPLADAALDINRELYEPPVPNEDEIKVLFSSVVALLAELKAIGALDIKRFKKEADKAAIPLKYEKLNSVAKLLNFLKDEFNVG